MPSALMPLVDTMPAPATEVADVVVDARWQARQLAQALHDELAQLLSLALMQLDAAREPDLPRALLAQQRAYELVKQALQASRDAVTLLQPEPVDDLPAALQTLVEQLRARTGLNIQFSCALSLPGLPEPINAGLLAAGRELLANACKHAGGVAIHIALARHADGAGVTLVVRDQGLGFDPQLAQAAAIAAGHGYGLPRLHARLRLLGMGLRLRSAPGLGVHAQVSWPRQPEEDES
ncbi:histidine kinase [Paucibacter sp. PLA-PC-4]|uniref:sensor histidine kinase n=1 Tax=Paucibacter sp. PLA-PC-4 TaxID=2993655 RepID=UPI0022490443|nr:ATP-binding protein [Paucibacter sp. PLA-PC-4]MCX2863289.1 histidine kinase [Paucibacter sp. PLA-PC-4]